MKFHSRPLVLILLRGGGFGMTAPDLATLAFVPSSK